MAIKTDINPAQYISAIRALENWRIAENIARMLKEKYAQAILAGAPLEEIVKIKAEAELARHTAGEMHQTICIRMGTD